MFRYLALFFLPILLFGQNENSIINENIKLKSALKKITENDINRYYPEFYDKLFSMNYNKLNKLSNEDIELYNYFVKTCSNIVLYEPNVGKLYQSCSDIINNDIYIQQKDEIFKEVLNQKYDEKKVNEAITKLEALKPFDSTFKIQIDKDEFIHALKNYKDVSCNAKDVFQKTYIAVQKAGITLSAFKSIEFDNVLLKKNSEESVVKFYETAKNKKFYPFLSKEIEKYKNNPTAFDDNSLIVDICTKEEIKEIVVEEKSEETTNK